MEKSVLVPTMKDIDLINKRIEEINKTLSGQIKDLDERIKRLEAQPGIVLEPEK